MSLRLDHTVRTAASTLNRPGTVWTPGVNGETLGRLLHLDRPAPVGAYPDGGILWDAAGVPLVAAEAKKQGATGNEIERWYKNAAILHAIGVTVYVTLCVGDGFFHGNSAQRTLELAALLDQPDRNPDTLWNTPTGRLWLYRWPAPPTTATIRTLLGEAVDAATAAATAATAEPR